MHSCSSTASISSVVGYRVHDATSRPSSIRSAWPPRNPLPLNPGHYGLTADDFDREVMTTFGGRESRPMRLRELIDRLNRTYSGHIGFEYMHIAESRNVREWIQQRIEVRRHRSLAVARRSTPYPNATDRRCDLRRVRPQVSGWERPPSRWKVPETLVPLLDLALESAADDGVKEVVMAMAHRGRLNVLANICGKRQADIFREFDDPYSDWYRGRGDVKYHMGASGDWLAANGEKLHISLCFNPSHLEYVNPIAMGRVRAKQDRIGDFERRKGMCVLIHGDAAFAGEGVVQETLNLTDLPAYFTGGTLHVILNNQVGFTTGPEEGRSSTYASAVAKMLPVPIFHVNGEYPQAVARVVELAMDFRSAFQRDVFIDLYSFRRWGHNEADEPSFTQPLVYKAIENRPTVRDSYLKHLVALGKVTQEEGTQIAEAERTDLEREYNEAKSASGSAEQAAPAGFWQQYFGGNEPDDGPETGIPIEQLQKLLERLTRIPDGFHLHKKLQKVIERRQKMAKGEEPLDWSTAEALAFASLAVEGHPVRLSGQDSERGTFSQRHAVLHDITDNHKHRIFNHLGPGQARVDIINSPLCETGTMGFEYGYSLDYPEGLILWEAQYGDFVNAAQVIIDQFISSAEDKWRRLSGVVLLLPHAMEGKGPEHTSARLERFQFHAAEDNLQIVTPSTPAQYFHCLRRQVVRNWRKPLIVLTPKSLLRHPLVTSKLEDLATGRMQRILPDQRAKNQRRRLSFCSVRAKMYYDLVEAREKQGFTGRCDSLR